MYIKELEEASILDPASVSVKKLLDYENDHINDWTLNPEHLDFKTSIAQGAAVTDLGNIPLVVLVASDTTENTTDPQLQELFKEVWRRSNQELCSLSSNCRVELVEGTNHASIMSSSAFDKALREVYDDATKKK